MYTLSFTLAFRLHVIFGVLRNVFSTLFAIRLGMFFFNFHPCVYVVDGQYFVWRVPVASSAWIHVKSSTRRSAFGIRYDVEDDFA